MWTVVSWATSSNRLLSRQPAHGIVCALALVYLQLDVGLATVAGKFFLRCNVLSQPRRQFETRVIRCAPRAKSVQVVEGIGAEPIRCGPHAADQIMQVHDLHQFVANAFRGSEDSGLIAECMVRVHEVAEEPHRDVHLLEGIHVVAEVRHCGIPFQAG